MGQIDGFLDRHQHDVEVHVLTRGGEADPDDAFAEGDIWAEALQRKGGSYRLLSTMPVDPSLN